MEAPVTCELSMNVNRFVMVSILNDRKKTPVARQTVNPVYSPTDRTFGFPIYNFLADRIGVVEIVIWDKDLLLKDYLGKVSLPLGDWFLEKFYGFNQPGNEMTLTLIVFCL